MKRAKAYLLQLHTLNDRINQSIHKLESLREAMFAGPSLDYSKDRVQTMPEDKLSQQMAEYVDLERKINGLIDRYVDLRQSIIYQIGHMKDPMHIELLMMYYVEFKTSLDITEELHRSRRWLFQKKNEALNAFETQYLVGKSS